MISINWTIIMVTIAITIRYTHIKPVISICANMTVAIPIRAASSVVQVNIAVDFVQFILEKQIKRINTYSLIAGVIVA